MPKTATLKLPEPVFPPETWERFWLVIFEGIDRVDEKEAQKNQVSNTPSHAPKT